MPPPNGPVPGLPSVATARFACGRGLASLVLSFVLASCSSVGVPGGPVSDRASPPPESSAIEGPSDADRSAAPPFDVPLPRLEPIAPIERVELDPILSSSAATDSTFQAQVAFWVDFWSDRQFELFTAYLGRMGQYGTLVEEELARRELPSSLRYLPIVESGYFPRAVSRVGATGLWQLMGPTARDLGLTVGSVVDERRDPFVATDAALDYLEQLHRTFGSWFLALAAYNVGPGRVRQLLTRSGIQGNDLRDEDFLAIRGLLPAETREFVPRFFAAAALASDPVPYGFPPIERVPVAFDEVRVPDATSLDVIARAAGVEEAVVVELNPQYLRGFTPVGSARTVRVPVGTGAAFDVAYAMIPPSERLSFLEHVVQNGETFSHIAARYNVSLSDLMDTNGGVDPRRLRIGMSIVVPVGGGGRVQQVASAGGSGGSLHTVREGESLWTIARRYGVTTDALARENERETNPTIRPGERLRIP